MKNYYDKELQRVLPTTANETVMLKIVNDDRSTKWLNINLESIESLQAFLDIVKEDLEEEE